MRKDKKQDQLKLILNKNGNRMQWIGECRFFLP